MWVCSACARAPSPSPFQLPLLPCPLQPSPPPCSPRAWEGLCWRPGGSGMGHAEDTGHPQPPFKERCTRSPSVTGSPSLPSTQCDSTLQTREPLNLIYRPRMYTIQSPSDPDCSQCTRTQILHSPQVTGCVWAPGTPHTHTHTHTGAAQSDVPDTRTLPPPYPKLKSERSNPSLEHHLPHGHPS